MWYHIDLQERPMFLHLFRYHIKPVDLSEKISLLGERFSLRSEPTLEFDVEFVYLYSMHDMYSYVTGH